MTPPSWQKREEKLKSLLMKVKEESEKAGLKFNIRIQIYSNAYIRNVEKWYWRIYLQGSHGEADIEKRLMDMERGEERVRCMERVTWKFALQPMRNLLYDSGNSNRGSAST